MFCNTCNKTVCVECCFKGLCSDHQKQVEMVSDVGERHVEMLRQQVAELQQVQHRIAQQQLKVDQLVQGGF